MRRLKEGSCSGGRPVAGRFYWLTRTLPAWSMLGLTLQGCGLRPCSPDQVRERTRIDLDERVDEWRVNGEEVHTRFIHAAEGCYLLDVKYRADYARVHGASSLWGVSPLAAAVETAARTHTSSYETGYIPFALQLRRHHTYYVTATFDGDEFIPRIVELNAGAERTREILPARSAQELELCKTQSPGDREARDLVCTGPAARTGLSP